MDSKFWNSLYQSKTENEVSWYQEVPEKSLELIAELRLAPTDAIIDIGGGDSRLADHLLSKEFTNISILDISNVALERAKGRLGERAKSVRFIASDITKFSPVEKFMLWHDRATFHFLRTVDDIEAYLNIADQAIVPGGYLIVSTFSKTRPEKCSGLTISQYSSQDLKKLFGRYFTNIICPEAAHHTPWGSEQNFVYCGFKKL